MIQCTKTICSRQDLVECLLSHLLQWINPFSYCNPFVPNHLSFLHMKLQMNRYWATKKVHNPFLKYFRHFGLTFNCLCKISFLQTKVCFQNFMIVLENVYVAQMVLNGFLYFGIFRTNSIVLNFFLQIHYQD